MNCQNDVKLIFWIVKVQNLPFFAISEALKFDFYEFRTPPKMAKMAVLKLLESLKLISHKI